MENQYGIKGLLGLALAVPFFVACGSDSGTSASEGASSGVSTESSSSVAAVTSSAVAGGTSSVAVVTPASSAESGIYSSASGDVSITLSDAGSTATNASCVAISGSTVKITCSGTYVFTGSLSNGQIQVEDASTDTGNVYLVLNGVSVTNTSDAPVYVVNAEKTLIVLPEGSTSTLTDASTRSPVTRSDGTLDTTGACVYSKDDLTIKGPGSLSVYGNYNNGIHSSNDLKFRDDPQVYVKAVNNGIKGKQSVDIDGGTFTVITTSGDGIKADSTGETGKDYVNISGGSFTITSGADGIQAKSYVLISGGTFNIQTGDGVANTTKSESMGGSTNCNSMGGFGPGGSTNCSSSSTSTGDSSSYKGIKADSAVTITGGTITLKTVEDAIHSNRVVNIEGGYITASGRRGIHADDTSNVTGGTFLVTNSYEGIEASVINMKGGVSAIYSTDDGWNASNNDANFGESPVIHVSGGVHYVKTGSGDTDGIDSNGDIYFEGGVLVVEAGGNIIDKGDNNNSVYYTEGVFLGFGTQNEGVPTSGNPVCYSGSVGSGTRFTVAPSSTVLSTFAATQSASMVVYFNSANTGSSAYTGGTVSGATETTLGSYGAYGEGGTINGAASVSMSTCSSSGPGGGW